MPYLKSRIKNIELFSVSIFIFCLLLTHKIFPTVNLFQEMVASLSFFVVLPVLYTKFILKKNIKSFGFISGDLKSGIIWSSVSLFVAFLLMYIAINYSQFLDKYIFPNEIASSFSSFLIYELFAVVGVIFIYDFFFRGFIISQFREVFNYWSILFQWSIFVILVFFQGFSWQFLPFMVFAPFSGYILLKSQSLFYGFVAQIIFMFIVDSWVIALMK